MPQKTKKRSAVETMLYRGKAGGLSGEQIREGVRALTDDSLAEILKTPPDVHVRNAARDERTRRSVRGSRLRASLGG